MMNGIILLTGINVAVSQTATEGAGVYLKWEEDKGTERDMETGKG